ncbi:MAG: putative sortase, partial [Candidatus Saccharibacteria bacterium]|nr:putative sortase [Candidatus Saccharibacteria bacterium]
PGEYKFVFTLLDKLQFNDRIFVDYKGTHYIYRVIGTSIVAPNDLTVLNQGSENILTLITCTPVGTSSKRLIIRAQQIVPTPPDDAKVDKSVTLPAQASGPLPSSNSSFWHDLRALF